MSSFDVFKGDAKTLSALSDGVEGTFAQLYKAEMKIAVFCIVIAMMLAGVSLAIHTKIQTRDISKAWVVRVVITAAILFAMSGLASLIYSTAI